MGALDGVRVIDWGGMIAAPFCARLLADFGAEVVKVEDPRGDEARRWGPFLKDEPDPERSGLFFYLNTNKQGVTLNVTKAEGRDLFLKLLADADVLVEDKSPQLLGCWNLDFDTLRKVNSRLIVTSVRPFGQSGPYAEYKTYSMNTYHASGAGYLWPSGDANPQLPPVKAGRFVGEYEAGTGAAIATLIALFHQRQTGLGQHIDLSTQEWIMGTVAYLLLRYPTAGAIPTRLRGAAPSPGLVRCKDGYVMIITSEDRHWLRLVELLGSPEWAGDECYRTAFGRARARRQLSALLEQQLKESTKEEFYRAAQRRGIPVGMICTPKDVVESEQLATRGFFHTMQHPRMGQVMFPGAPYALSGTPVTFHSPAPSLGEHNGQVYLGRLGCSTEDLLRLHTMGVV